MSKKLWLWILTLGAPLLVFFLRKHFLAEPPKVIYSDGNQMSTIEWSRDGKIVKIRPSSIVWPQIFFDARTRLKMADETGEKLFKYAAESKYFLKSNHDRFGTGGAEIPLFKKNTVSICATVGDKCQFLPETPSEYFKIDNDFLHFNHRYSSSQISEDNRLVSIIGDSQIKTWRTDDGKLVRRVRFIPTNQILKSVLSSDLNSVLLVLKNTDLATEGRAIYIDTVGKKRRISFPETKASDIGFSPNPKIIWYLSMSSATLTFHDTSNGKMLWKCLVLSTIHPIFSPDKQSVIVFGTDGLEVREIKTGHLERLVRGPRNITFAALSPDGTQVWTNDINGNILRWRIR